jgi:hypothetical protein
MIPETNEVIERKGFEIINNLGKTMDKPNYDASLIKTEKIGKTFNKNKRPKPMRKNQRKILNIYINSRRLSISEPPGAGKSMAIMFAMAWRIMNWKDHKVIIIVPQIIGSISFGKETLEYDDGTLFHWSIYTNLCSTSENQKVDAIVNFLHKRKFTKNPNERILIATHMAMARAFAKIGYSAELFDNTSFVIDEAHHIMYTKAEESFVTNQIGELVRAINGNQNCSIWLATATPFRGDRNSIIPPEQMQSFDIHFVPLDQHWADIIEHIKSFTFDFVIYKADKVFEAIKTLMETRRKTIIFCPYQGDLVEGIDKYIFRDRIISNIKTIWPECKFMDLIEETGRDAVKKDLFDKEKAREYDVILTLKMFDEATDWVPAVQCLDLTPSDTLRVMYQRFGRLWRDERGKTSIHYYCFLPYEADFDNEEKRRVHLSNAYNVFVATLLLQETVDPIPYPAKRPIKVQPPEIDTGDGTHGGEDWGRNGGDGLDFGPEDIPLNPLDKATNDENEREKLIHDIINKLLVMASHDSNPNFSEVYNWIGTVVDEHGIVEGRNDVITHVAKILRRLLKKKPDWVGEAIDISWMREANFDEIWSNDIFGSLLMFGTKTCGLEHFEAFRRIYSELKSIDEWVKIAERLTAENDDKFPTFSWLINNGYGGLTTATIKYPERFAHLEREFQSKSLEEWVIIAEKLAIENGGKLPTYQWLKTNGYITLATTVARHHDKFSHLEREFDHQTLEKQVLFAEQLAAENGGKIPSFKWLSDRHYFGLSTALAKHPNAFSHLEREFLQKTSDEHIVIAEKLAAENGGKLPTFKWLNNNGYHDLLSFISKYRQRFSHIKRERKRETLDNWVKLAEQLAAENGGKIPSFKWLRNSKYSALMSMLNRYPNAFSHLKRERLQRLLQDSILLAEKLAVENGGKLPTPTWLKSNGYRDINTSRYKYPDKFSHLIKGE